MPIFPHIDVSDAPDWVRYSYSACAFGYAIVMLCGAYVLFKRSLGK